METSLKQETGRRPLATRTLKVTQKIASWLSKKNIRPNQISMLSIVFAILGFFFMYSYGIFAYPILILLSAISIQARLLCNLFDGMVAIEGGKKTVTGELFNDVPDRIADVLFITGAGFLTKSEWGMNLAWACALLSVFTAYIRVLGGSVGVPLDFRGPMAKQQRMALLTLSLIIFFTSKIIGIGVQTFNYTLDICLWVMLIGCIITSIRRLMAISRALHTMSA